MIYQCTEPLEILRRGFRLLNSEIGNDQKRSTISIASERTFSSP